MSASWQSRARVDVRDFSISNGVSDGALHDAGTTHIFSQTGTADLSRAPGNVFAPSAAHLTTPFSGAHSLAPAGHPIPGPATSTVVFDYTAILDSSWYNLFPGDSPAADHPVILTYSFETAAQDYLIETGFSAAFRDSFVPFSAGEKALARDALAKWADISGIIFIEVGAGSGDTQFGKYDFGLAPGYAGAAGFAYYGSLDDSNGRDDTGDVFLDSGTATTTLTLLHEIGHTLGFKHPFDGDPTLDPSVDDHAHTVMSYTGGDVSDLGPFDVDAVHHVYGVAADDGTHVASWSWSAAKKTLTQSGFATANLIRGIHGKDTISGNGGDDEIYGNAGNDTLKGGSGNDTIHAGDGDDTVYGGDGNDHIVGGWGAETLNGDAGNDTIDDTDGVDTVDGGKGNDTVNHFRYANGADQVWTLTATTNGVSLSDGSTILNTETIWIDTGDGDDTATFVNLDKGTYGFAGGDGTDTATIDFSASRDFVVSDDGVVVTNYTGGTFKKNVYLVDVETMHVIGGKAGDTLGGGAGADTLEGGKGADFITGDLGKDLLIGGIGADTFNYDAVAESTGPGRDTIDGFNALQDNFDVISTIAGVDTMVTMGALSQGTFNADLTTALTTLGAGHVVLFSPSSGGLHGKLFLIVDQDGTSGYDAGLDIVIQLTHASNISSLAAGNFAI